MMKLSPFLGLFAAILMLGCGKESKFPTSPSMPSGETASVGAQPLAPARETVEEIPSEGWYYHTIQNITRPNGNPTLRFFAGTYYGTRIYTIRTTLQVWCQPIGDEKEFLVGTETEENHYATSAEVLWDVSFPFAWAGRSKAEHYWFDARNKQEWTHFSERGPVEALWVIERISP